MRFIPGLILLALLIFGYSRFFLLSDAANASAAASPPLVLAPVGKISAATAAAHFSAPKPSDFSLD